VQQPDDLLAHQVQVGAQLRQDLRRDAVALADQAEQEVLGADVVVTERLRLAQRQLEHLLGPRRVRDLLLRLLLALADDLLDLLPHGVQADPQRFQGPRRDALALADQAEQEVLGPDVVVIESPGFVLRQVDRLSRPVGKPLKHPARRPSWPPLDLWSRYIALLPVARYIATSAQGGEGRGDGPGRDQLGAHLGQVDHVALPAPRHQHLHELVELGRAQDLCRDLGSLT
jgi:hypothetical protein